MAKYMYMASSSIVKIEAKAEISQNFLRIYQKVLLENLNWYIIYTIKEYFLMEE